MTNLRDVVCVYLLITNFPCFQVEQLHRIFRLCGTPSQEYWKKLKLSTTFIPPKSYRPSLVESFKDLPPSSLGLLCTLLALDPAFRGSASKALKNQVSKDNICFSLLEYEFNSCFVKRVYNNYMLKLFQIVVQFFFTSPLACDLSGLPAIYKGDDEHIQAKEQIK